MAVAPPSRSARAAVLASSVQRSKPTPYPSKARSALIRRAIVVGLVIVALALVTISFRSPTAGALHDVQGAGSTALRPFQLAATRIAQPFRDGYDWVASISSAKRENAQLKRELRELRLQAIGNRAAAMKAQQTREAPALQTGQDVPERLPRRQRRGHVLPEQRLHALARDRRGVLSRGAAQLAGRERRRPRRDRVERPARDGGRDAAHRPVDLRRGPRHPDAGARDGPHRAGRDADSRPASRSSST